MLARGGRLEHADLERAAIAGSNTRDVHLPPHDRGHRILELHIVGVDCEGVTAAHSAARYARATPMCDQLRRKPSQSTMRWEHAVHCRRSSRQRFNWSPGRWPTSPGFPMPSSVYAKPRFKVTSGRSVARRGRIDPTASAIRLDGVGRGALPAAARCIAFCRISRRIAVSSQQ